MPARPAGAILAVLLALAAAACGGADDAGAGTAEEGLSIVATTTVLGDLVERVAGEEAAVRVLMPVGVDPHAFSPSAAQADAVRAADLVVANGLGFEEGLLDVLDAAAAEGAVVFAATDHVDLIAFPEEADGHADEEQADDHGDEDDHGDHDPHVWLDPSRMAQAVEALGAALTEIEATGGWAARAAEVAADLRALDDEVEGILDVVPEERRVLITTHDVLGYFADRYGFEVVGTIIPGGTTLAEPSAAGLDDLIETVVDAGVPAVFAESTNPSRLAEVIAEEAGDDLPDGVAVVELFTESLSEPDGPAATYEGMIRTNAQRVADALAP